MPLGRACDACKRRKVKCDAGNPCANCRISELACEFRIRPRRRGRTENRAAKCPRGSSQSPLSIPSAPRAQPPLPTPAEAAHLGQWASPVPQDIPFHTAPEPLRPNESPATSRPSVATPHEVGSYCSSSAAGGRYKIGFVLDASQIHENLARTVISITSTPLDAAPGIFVGILHRCINLFMQYLFPNTPIAHEHSLRSSVALFEHDGDHPFDVADESRRIASMRSFTLITALCAYVTAVMPSELIPEQSALCWPFYHASRSMLKLYEEYDLEYPDSSSFNIRTWQSAALQNTSGKEGASWHIHGEATLLAMRARLYDEESIRQRPGIEQQILRANFWLMYLADKTAAAFESRPFVINDVFLDDKLTLLEQGTDEEPLLDPLKPHNQGSLETILAAGFHLKKRLWAAAADLINEIKLYSRRALAFPVGSPTPLAQREIDRLTDLYHIFISLVDDVPDCLRFPHLPIPGVDEGVAAYQTVCFWAQRSNIMTVYHCMKLIILQKCIDASITCVVGLDGKTASLAMRKIEIAQDFLREAQVVPFVCFKVQGEPAVERLRRVGGILLEVANKAENEIIRGRANFHLQQLLDMLANLNSKSSEKLSDAEFYLNLS
ncbi:hypothetical protein BJX66DRAFT_344329 [Aspergillus keveii]|uniref:Zn(2)-C6 fungal-type domain-containing protein n=1 Tax=Aspergillus keveii TaxID=714993 RepID=A0ABR4FLJ0_9EURO